MNCGEKTIKEKKTKKERETRFSFCKVETCVANKSMRACSYFVSLTTSRNKYSCYNYIVARLLWIIFNDNIVVHKSEVVSIVCE